MDVLYFFFLKNQKSKGLNLKLIQFYECLIEEKQCVLEKVLFIKAFDNTI